MTEQYVIASSRRWNKNLVSDLNAKVDGVFLHIADPTQMTAEYLSRIKPRYVFFPHWSHRIPSEILQRFECVIFHMTDLPFGRGGSPLQNLIARGIYETKISALRCVEVIDAGPIYLKRPLSLLGAAEEIYLRASKVIEEMIVEIIQSSPIPQAQVGEPTYFGRRKPEDSNLAGADSLQSAFDLIRMLDAEGYPNAFLEIGRMRLEFSRAKLRADDIAADVKISIVRDVREG